MNSYLLKRVQFIKINNMSSFLYFLLPIIKYNVFFIVYIKLNIYNNQSSKKKTKNKKIQRKIYRVIIYKEICKTILKKNQMKKQ